MYDSEGGYICEVRYGGVNANALRRDLWTHTTNATKYFDSLTDGWISYSHNETLVKLLSHAMVASSRGHDQALSTVKADSKTTKR